MIEDAQLRVGETGEEQKQQTDKPANTATTAAAGSSLQGYIERYGLHSAAGGLVFFGWLSHEWMAGQEGVLTATFERGAVTGHAVVAAHERKDLHERGVGVCLFLPTRQRRIGGLIRLELQFRSVPTSVNLIPKIREISEKAVVEHVGTVPKGPDDTSNMLALREQLSRQFIAHGFVDYYGYHPASHGWLISGWVSEDWATLNAPPDEAVALFSGAEVAGKAVLALFERDDLAGKGMGIILHITGGKNQERLVALQMRAGLDMADLRPSATMAAMSPEAIAAHISTDLHRADLGPGRDAIQALLSRDGFDGQDTLARLQQQLALEIDEMLVCPGDSLVLFGWMLSRPGVVRTLRLRSGPNMAPVDMEGPILWFERNDVISGFGAERGFEDPSCGFILRIPLDFDLQDDAHIEVETTSGAVGFRKLPQPRRMGLPAMKRLLGVIDNQYADIDRRYDNIFGPAVRSLNAARLATPPRIETMVLGEPPREPRVSVVIPLYGRIDFMEAQLAFFSAHGISGATEIIYVLDDPPKRLELQALAASLYARFTIPYQVLLLSHNVGFAPASNIGMRAATAPLVCFMNSDVFPVTPDWPTRLADRLEANPDLGVIGPLLMFEDGSVQHQGVYFAKLPMFGNWHFPHHRHKGWRVPPGGGLVYEPAITGACMLIRRDLALDLGGFDEAFVVGDFEDTDLCMKLAARGLASAVDLDVRMHHLERKSQAAPGQIWRLNLTLYNAWVHQRRWGAELDRADAP